MACHESAAHGRRFRATRRDPGQVRARAGLAAPGTTRPGRSGWPSREWARRVSQDGSAGAGPRDAAHRATREGEAQGDGHLFSTGVGGALSTCTRVRSRAGPPRRLRGWSRHLLSRRSTPHTPWVLTHLVLRSQQVREAEGS